MTDDNNVPLTEAERDQEKDAGFAAITIVVAIALAIAYFAVFAGLFKFRDTSPDAWALFGDFFGGVVNPLVGLTTVVLVVRTLRATRKEAADTREQLVRQIQNDERTHILSEMRYRLDGLFKEWEGLLAADDARIEIYAPGGLSIARWKTRGAALADPRFGQLISDESHSARNAERWRDVFRRCGALLKEFGVYCAQYDQFAGNEIVTDYYRRRLALAVEALDLLGMVDSLTIDILAIRRWTIDASYDR